MPATAKAPLEPRKLPVQTRSTETVDAIMDATLQVLAAIGKERLTTTRVAARAGVSVGTLYQYFPNKVALLQAALRRHMDRVVQALVDVTREQKGKDLLQMADQLVHAFLRAKLHHVPESVALYAVSSDIDGMEIAREAYARAHTATAAMFASSPNLCKSPELVATTVLASMNGMSRRLLESTKPEKELAGLSQELLLLVQAYLRVCLEPTKP